MIYLILFVFISIFYLNSRFFFSQKWFYPETDKIVTGQAVSYKIQEKLAEAIINDANGRSFRLKRIGDFDYYEDNYAQNYIYLLWLRGNEPKKNADLTYTIYDDLKLIPADLKSKDYIPVANTVILKDISD